MPRFRRKSYRRKGAKLATTTVKTSRSDAVQNRVILKMKKDLGELKKEAIEYKIVSPISVNAGTIVSLVDTPNPAAGQLSLITAGTAMTNRSGERVVLSKLVGNYFADAQIALAFCHVRYVVFWDMQPVPTVPATWGQVFAGTAGNEFIWLPVFENRHRFKIVKDVVWKLGMPTDNSAAALGTLHKRYTIPLKKTLVRFSGTVNTDVIGKHLYSFMVTNVSNIGGASVQQNWEVDLHFTDN